jgi:hypothetical protein
MNLQFRRAVLVVILTVAASLPAATGRGQIAGTLERAGRLHGLCWGDGYHACQSSGVRPLADLPPRTVAPTASIVSHPKRHKHRPSKRATYYDHFDARRQADWVAEPCENCVVNEGWEEDREAVQIDSQPPATEIPAPIVEPQPAPNPQPQQEPELIPAAPAAPAAAQPVRLGSRTGRPIVELAERTTAADENVVRQPSFFK